jgi:hypothetical protein
MEENRASDVYLKTVHARMTVRAAAEGLDTMGRIASQNDSSERSIG